jgi:hypothetical protein
VALLPARSAELPHWGSVFVRLKAPLEHAKVMAVQKPGADRGARAALIEPLGMIAGRMK